MTCPRPPAHKARDFFKSPSPLYFKGTLVDWQRNPGPCRSEVSFLGGFAPGRDQVFLRTWSGEGSSICRLFGGKLRRTRQIGYLRGQMASSDKALVRTWAWPGSGVSLARTWSWSKMARSTIKKLIEKRLIFWSSASQKFGQIFGWIDRLKGRSEAILGSESGAGSKLVTWGGRSRDLVGS